MGSDWNAIYLIIAEGIPADLDLLEKYFYSEGIILTSEEDKFDSLRNNGMRNNLIRISNNKIYITIKDDDSTGPGYWHTHSNIKPLALRFPSLNFVNIFFVEMNKSSNYMFSEMGFEEFVQGKITENLILPIGGINWNVDLTEPIFYEELYRKMRFVLNFRGENLSPDKMKIINRWDKLYNTQGYSKTEEEYQFEVLISREEFISLEKSYFESLLYYLINNSTSISQHKKATDDKSIIGLIYTPLKLKKLTEKYILKKGLENHFEIAKDFLHQQLPSNYSDTDELDKQVTPKIESGQSDKLPF